MKGSGDPSAVEEKRKIRRLYKDELSGKIGELYVETIGDVLLKVTTETFESDEAQARMGPCSKGAQATELTVGDHKESDL
jgi:hypothetical protein